MMQPVAFVDLFDKLKATPTVIEKILDMLDDKSLRNVQSVCRLWNVRVNEGHTWKKKLIRKANTNSMWKQVYEQLPVTAAESDFPDKDLFKKMVHSVQNLKSNWRSGSAHHREVVLKNFDIPADLQFYCKSLLSMDKDWIAIGSAKGEIRVFDRKTLKGEKPFFHGEKMVCIKLTGNYLISASLLELKVWKKESWNLVETVGGLDRSDCAGHFFAAGHGLLVHMQNLLSHPSGLELQSNKFFEGGTSVQFSVWRLQDPPSSDSKKISALKLMRKEKYKTHDFLSAHVHLSDQHIISYFGRNLMARNAFRTSFDKHNFFIEVRSNVNFDILHKIMDHIGLVNPISFVGEKVLFQTSGSLEGTFIKVVDCIERTTKEVKWLDIVRGARYIQSNSHFAVGTKYGTKTELFDFSPIFGESPKGSFQLNSLCVLKGLELRINHKSLPELDFIMDELSIVQYYQREGKGDAKLVIIDFYKEFGSNGFPNPGIIDRCFTCNQGGELKKCSRCRSISYCSIQCQRSNWNVHKLNCTKAP